MESAAMLCLIKYKRKFEKDICRFLLFPPKSTPSKSARRLSSLPFNRLLEGVVFTISGYQNSSAREVKEEDGEVEP